MRVLIYGCFFIFLLSCHERNTSGKTQIKDSAITGIVKDTLIKPSLDTIAKKMDSMVAPAKFEEIFHKDVQDYHIIILRNSEKACLVAYNKTTQKSDTAEISGRDISMDEIDIVNLADSVQIQPLFLDVTTPRGSDWFDHDFIGYDSGKLKQLFDLDKWANGKEIELHRKDKWTLSGSVCGQDELVSFVEDYPIEVSLKDYKITTPKISKVEVGFVTKAKASFKGRLVINNQLTDSVYKVKNGARVTVDTLYFSPDRVRLTINDSIVIIAPTPSVKGKIQEDTAG